jgi:hypothetical protein
MGMAHSWMPSPAAALGAATWQSLHVSQQGCVLLPGMRERFLAHSLLLPLRPAEHEEGGFCGGGSHRE